MPRAESLSTRLEALLEAVFQSPGDPVSLYWEIAGHLQDDQLAQVQKKIRKTLRQKGEIATEAAVLTACVLHLTGFPAHRILHFLSLYVPGGIRLSLFELAVGAIFLGEPPIPAPLLYDLTQYTYLEKRLLARRSIEISDRLKGSLSPRVLLYLYLLSLRDDLSNENIQLIALIMKNCFPALEVRTRIGGASLEEYGEIARAWKNAEQRSRALDVSAGSGAEKRAGKPFDRDSASFFLDRYFSDQALAEMRAAAPPPTARKPPRGKPAAGPAGAPSRAAASPRLDLARERAAVKGGGERAAAGRAAPAAADAAISLSAPGTPAEGRSPRAGATAGSPGSRPPRKARARSVAGGRRARPVAAQTAHAAGAAHAAHTAASPAAAAPVAGVSKRRPRAGLRVVLPRAAPTLLAAVVAAVLLVSVPAGFRGGARPSPAAVPPAPAAAPAHPVPAVSPAPTPPLTTTYVVKPGDSLWKIFTTVRSQRPDQRGWMDFLSNTQSMNSLNDPDRLQPGRVLTITVHR